MTGWGKTHASDIDAAIASTGLNLSQIKVRFFNLSGIRSWSGLANYTKSAGYTYCTVKKKACNAHQIWCATFVLSGTPYTA